MVEQSRETPVEHRSGEPVETKLLRIAAKARKEPKLEFVNLYYLMKEELLFECRIQSDLPRQESRRASLPEPRSSEILASASGFKLMIRSARKNARFAKHHHN